MELPVSKGLRLQNASKTAWSCQFQTKSLRLQNASKTAWSCQLQRVSGCRMPVPDVTLRRFFSDARPPLVTGVGGYPLLLFVQHGWTNISKLMMFLNHVYINHRKPSIGFDLVFHGFWPLDVLRGPDPPCWRVAELRAQVKMSFFYGSWSTLRETFT